MTTQLEFTDIRSTRMHAGHLATSTRLQKLNAILSDGQWHGTWELAQALPSCAVHSDVAGLRANGIAIVTRAVRRGRYEYRKSLSCGQQESGSDYYADSM